jgi:serine-type D-Ala-D-Ala carboxypeptidase (penicillin-binding protein 5/6)
MKRISLVASLFALFLLLVPAWAQESKPPFESKAPHAILIDPATGEVLFEKDADRSIQPASMSKLMTQAIVFDLLKSGELKEDQEIQVSKDAWQRGGAPSGSSTMYANVNSKVSVINLLRGAIIQSANDACIILAEGIAGSEAAFVTRMNTKAKELGLLQSTFANSTGLPDPNHLMSARDLSTVAGYILLNHPTYFKIYSEPEFTWNKIAQSNRNPLLKDFPGADGMKTGYTKEAGYGLVGTAERDGRRLVMVVAGLTSIEDRKNEAVKLLDWGFRQFKPFVVYEAEDVVGTARVWGGESRSVNLVIPDDFKVALSPKEQETVEVKLEYNGPLLAPVKAGSEVGKVRIIVAGRVLSEQPVRAQSDIAPITSMWRKAADSMMMMVFGG